MKIKRLKKSNSPATIGVEINEELLPYFEQFYLSEKGDNESKEEFALRLLKRQIIRHHSQKEIMAQEKALDENIRAEKSALAEDSKALQAEL